MLLGNFERRLFGLFKPGYANKPKGNPRQEGSDGFQTFKYEDSEKQSSLSIVKRHIHSIRRFQVWSVVGTRPKRHIPLSQINWELQEILWNTSIFW